MGMRQIESMNNILNIVGKYNDFIIPTGPSGEPPIQFEVMQGQDIQTPSDMMDRMEEQTINHVVPFEFVNSVMQQDFATRFSMTNTRFLKMVTTCQRATQKFFSAMYTKIYNYEYDEHFARIDIILPPPLYLIMTNNSQLMDNISQTADKLIEANLSDQEDEVKSEFKRLYIRSMLGTYIDYDSVDRMIQTAKVNVEANKDAATDDGGSAEDYM